MKCEKVSRSASCGKASKGGGLLVKVQEPGQLEQQVAGQQRECATLQAQLQGTCNAVVDVKLA